jgi:diadenosine tetraphosphate (Ap4A) HIT family hydrolase
MATARWPEDWSERKLGQGCPICPALGQGDNEVWVRVIEGTWSEVFLERRTPVLGYCIVAWKRGHVSEPTELLPADASGYWRDVLEVGKAVQDCFQPIKLNYMLLGNTVPHLHTHIVPRYLNDPAPAGPIPWDTIFSSEKVEETELRRHAADLRRLLEARSFDPRGSASHATS